MDTIGERIRFMRQKRSLTQDQLGDVIGVKRQAISRWEKDHTIIPRSKIDKIATALECSPMYLLGFDHDQKVTVTYSARGRKPVKALVDTPHPIIGQASKRAQLCRLAAQIPDEDIEAAIVVLQSMCPKH